MILDYLLPDPNGPLHAMDTCMPLADFHITRSCPLLGTRWKATGEARRPEGGIELQGLNSAVGNLKKQLRDGWRNVKHDPVLLFTPESFVEVPLFGWTRLASSPSPPPPTHALGLSRTSAGRLGLTPPPRRHRPLPGRRYVLCTR